MFYYCLISEKAAKKKFGPKQCIFSEGWVEFRDKKVAKRVAFSLNNCQISNKRSSRWFDEIWNIKYLPKFQWGHLNERLAYERAVRKQRLRIEIAQVKKETGFFVQNLEKNKVLKRLEKKQKLNLQSQQREWSFKQKKTDDEIVLQNLSDKANAVPSMKKAQHKVTSAATNTNFLKTLFSGGIQTGKTSVNVDLTS